MIAQKQKILSEELELHININKNLEQDHKNL